MVAYAFVISSFITLIRGASKLQSTVVALFLRGENSLISVTLLSVLFLLFLF